MPIITEHRYTISGKDGIKLQPLCDKHLPLLYRWNSDTEVLYWSEGDDVVEPYDHETVEQIFGSVSKDAYCFLITKDDVPIGECWVQKMNIPPIVEQYPAGTHVARIDYCIGEKAYWGQGIGTECVRLLLDFAFSQAGYDVVYALVYDYNERSIRLIEHAGFELERKMPVPHNGKAKYELNYKATKTPYLFSAIDNNDRTERGIV